MRFRKIYVMWAPGLPYVFKIGISTAPRLRAMQITDELDMNCSIVTSRVLVVASVPSPLSERHEAFLHRLFAPFRAQMRRHSGHTEWFYSFFPNTIAACIAFIAMKLSGIDVKALIIPLVAITPYPVGAVMALFIVFAVEILLTMLIASFIVAFIYLLFN